MIMRIIRWPIGQLILLADALTAPRPPQRAPEAQARIDAVTRGLALYQFKTCPFCVKARRAMRRLGVTIELRDARSDPRWREQLIAEGGKLQVPCLRIPQADGDARWLYESDAIVAYLEAVVADSRVADAA